MGFITKIKITTRFLLLILLFLVAISIEGGLVIYNSYSVSNQSQSLSDQHIPILNKAHQLKLSVVQVQQWLTDISATRGRDGLNDGFDEAEKNTKKFNSLIEELTSLDSARKEHYQAMLPVFQAYYDVGRKMAQSYIDDGPAGGNNMMGQFDEVAAKIGDQVNTFLDEVISQTNLVLENQREAADHMLKIVVVGIIVLLVVLVITYFTMSRALGVLPTVLAELNRVTQGDLTSSIEVTRQDEMGELMSGLKTMQQQLRGLLSTINDTTEHLATSSAELSTSSMQSSSNIEQQRQETEQIATAMNEMSVTVKDVAKNVSLTAASAAEANRETDKGGAVVDDALKSIQELAVQIENTGNTIFNLGQDSENINSVVDVIKGIAEQTNLLALNAAIEAARAGDKGRGFAVVADEVRTLASRTQDSTTEINQMIDRVQSGTKETIQAMGHIRDQVTSVVGKAEEAGVSLNHIRESVLKIDQMSDQIATAAEEQSSVAEEMNKNIVRINGMAIDNAERAEETARSGKNLTELSSKLQGLVSKFSV